jgi:hypothetical protein
MVLAAGRVLRSGSTVKGWNPEPTEVKLTSNGLALFFQLKSKGGGITDVKALIGAEDYPSVLASMVSAHRGLMLREMAAILKNELDRQPEVDKATVRAARMSVASAAEHAFRNAPEGRDHAERLTRDMVSQLVSRLNKDEDSTETAPE